MFRFGETCGLFRRDGPHTVDELMKRYSSMFTVEGEEGAGEEEGKEEGKEWGRGGEEKGWGETERGGGREGGNLPVDDPCWWRNLPDVFRVTRLGWIR